MFAAIAVLFFVPWLDTSKVKSARYRPLYKQFFWIFVGVCLVLGWLGGQPAEGWYIPAAQIFTALYFAFFLVFMPLLGLIETPKPVPTSISDAVLAENGGSHGDGGSGGGGAPAGATAAPDRNV